MERVYPLEPVTETLARLRAQNDDTREIVEPAADELFIDLDSEADEETLTSMIALLRTNGEAVTITRNSPSQTEGHRHVVVLMNRDLMPLERIALQACMGSDRKRELLAVLRVWNDITPVTVFFEEPNGKD